MEDKIAIYVLSHHTLTKMITSLTTAVIDSYKVDNSTLNRNDIAEIVYDAVIKCKKDVIV